jgi:ATP-dependent RNA helicase DDX46/PRP5
MPCTNQVPKDLRAINEEIKKARKAGEKQKHSSGFGGKGFKFDEEEAKKRLEAQKKNQKMLLLENGEEVSEDEEEKKRAEEQELEFEEQAGNLTSQHAQKVAQWTADTIEKEKNMAFNDLVKKATGGLLLKDLNLATAVQHSQSAGLLNNAPANPAPPPPGGASTALVTSDVAARAQAAAAALGLAPAAPGGMAGGGALALMPGVGDAARMAALKAAQAVNNTGMGQEEAHASAELEINDYPQHARWKVTQKDNVAPVTEFNDVCVTAKVSFLAARLVKIPEV